MGTFSDGLDWFDKYVNGMNNLGWKGVMDLFGFDQADANRFQSMLSDVPVIGDVLRLQQRQEQISDYLGNRGMTWADVEYPSLLGGTGVYSAFRSGTNFVSKNIENLYRD